MQNKLTSLLTFTIIYLIFACVAAAWLLFLVLFGVTAPMGVAAILTSFCFTRRKEVAEDLESTVGWSDLTVSVPQQPENLYNPPFSMMQTDANDQLW